MLDLMYMKGNTAICLVTVIKLIRFNEKVECKMQELQ